MRDRVDAHIADGSLMGSIYPKCLMMETGMVHTRAEALSYSSPGRGVFN